MSHRIALGKAHHGDTEVGLQRKHALPTSARSGALQRAADAPGARPSLQGLRPPVARYRAAANFSRPGPIPTQAWVIPRGQKTSSPIAAIAPAHQLIHRGVMIAAALGFLDELSADVVIAQPD